MEARLETAAIENENGKVEPAKPAKYDAGGKRKANTIKCEEIL